VTAVQLFNDSGDFFFFNLLLMKFKLSHCLLNIFLSVSVSSDDMVVLLLQGFELMLQLLNRFGAFLDVFSKKLIFIEIGFKLT